MFSEKIFRQPSNFERMPSSLSAFFLSLQDPKSHFLLRVGNNNKVSSLTVLKNWFSEKISALPICSISKPTGRTATPSYISRLLPTTKVGSSGHHRPYCCYKPAATGALLLGNDCLRQANVAHKWVWIFPDFRNQQYLYHKGTRLYLMHVRAHMCVYEEGTDVTKR